MKMVVCPLGNNEVRLLGRNQDSEFNSAGVTGAQIPIWLSAGKIQMPKDWIQKTRMRGIMALGPRSLLYCPVGQDGLARGRQTRAEARVEIMRNHIDASLFLSYLTFSNWPSQPCWWWQLIWVSLTFSRDSCLSHSGHIQSEYPIAFSMAGIVFSYFHTLLYL